MKSFIKISMLFGVVSVLAAGSANAGGVVTEVNDKYMELGQENSAQPQVSEERNDSQDNIAETEIVSPANEISVVAVSESAKDESEKSVNEISESIDKTAASEVKSDAVDSAVVAEGKPDDNTFETASVMSSEDLEENRGAFSPSSASYLLGNSSNNTANNTITGGNVISEGAFNSSSGVVSVIQNSGNNVLIQSSTVVNVEMNQ